MVRIAQALECEIDFILRPLAPTVTPAQRSKVSYRDATPLPSPILNDLPHPSAMRTFHYTVYREDDDFVAQCLDFDVSSFGATEQEAIRNLKEAIELYLEDLPPTEHIPHITNVTVGELAIA